MKLDLLYEIDVPEPWPGPIRSASARPSSAPTARPSSRSAWPTARLPHHWHVEHHFREGRSHCPAPEVVLGALSQITEQIRLGFGVTLLPHAFGPPMRVAEKVATVDILSDGRVEWGTGRSTPMEQTAFGVDRDNSRDQWQEAIEAIVGMWESEYFEFHGKYLDFPRRMVTPKPVQDPHPPAWMAATSDGSAAMAGEMGLGLLVVRHHAALERMAAQIASTGGGGEPGPRPSPEVHNNRVAAYTLVHCADTMAQCEADGIWDSVWWWYKNLAEFTIEWELPHLPNDQQDIGCSPLKRQIEGDFDPH